MGKAKKIKVSKNSLETDKYSSLTEQILEDKSVRAPGRTKSRKRNEDDDEYVDEKLSRKILEQARKQQEDLEDELGYQRPKKHGKKKTVSLGGAGPSTAAEDNSDSESELSEDEDQDYETVEVDEEDEKALQMFMSKEAPIKRTLADIIMEKITEKQTEIHSQMSDNASVQLQQLDDRVVNMYKSISHILQKYRSGKLPKAFKVIPHLRNWEQILYITEPDLWSAAAVYQATRIFASNLNAKMAQRFFNLILLPRIRDDITEYKRLNFHLYMAIRKSLFKPAAFFKGVLLPLCEAGNCTLREAIIMSSILAKNSIPMLHSAAAILKIAEMDYNGANSIFLKTLLDKKYALPYRVVDAVVFHFMKQVKYAQVKARNCSFCTVQCITVLGKEIQGMHLCCAIISCFHIYRFTTDKRELPVLWHQSLLTFVQRYKEDISSEQKEALMELLRVHSHEQITPEVRRELMNSKCRDVETLEGEMAASGSSSMELT